MKPQSFRSLLLVLMMATLASCGLFKPGPSKVVKNFYHAVEAGKIEEASGMLSSEVSQTFGAKLSAVLSSQTRKIERSGGIKSIETKETVTGDLAKVDYVVTYKDDSTETGTIDLVKEKGEWKIQLTGK